MANKQKYFNTLVFINYKYLLRVILAVITLHTTFIAFKQRVTKKQSKPINKFE